MRPKARPCQGPLCATSGEPIPVRPPKVMCHGCAEHEITARTEQVRAALEQKPWTRAKLTQALALQARAHDLLAEASRLLREGMNASTDI